MADPLHPYSTQPWMAEPNHGVPGDWVTGSRMLDVAVLPLFFAVGFPLLREFLKKYFFQPWGESVFIGLQKRQDKQWSKEEYSKKLTKWNESCWKGVVYIIFSTTAFLVTFREKFFLDPFYFWTDCNQFPLNYYVPFKISLFYMLEIGFYLQAIPFLMLEEVRRKDWKESFAHHVVTLGLMYYSWYANFTRPGVLVMLIHDISDIFLESAKLANYAEQESLSLNLFIAFALSWVVLRCVIYPYMIVARVLVDPVLYVALPYNINPQPHYSAFGTMFLVLFFLHLYWTYLIFKVIEKQLRTGKADDVREEDDD